MSAADFQQFMSQVDVQALKDYVKAPGKCGGANQSDGTVLLSITHSNLKARFMEIRFDRHLSIGGLKDRLQSHCGSSPSAMTLQLKDFNNTTVAIMDDENRPLGYYSPEDGYSIHIIDSDPFSLSKNGWLEDTSLVEKYKISDKDYESREQNYRKFKNEKLAEDPEWCIEKEMAKKRGVEYVPREVQSDPNFMQDLAHIMSVGQRCEVQPGAKRGEIKYVGQAKEGLPLGYWIGVQYDEPVGKNDGSVKGARYFECDDGFGGMIRPDKVSVGDFPPIDEFDFSDEEI
ncbi:hypothetical protein CYMTET_4799 [Cymbomonas tetramitiformis]|uniref:CAP-Gly domain-containing protein n=1 Tax=Cymbomonas tetramitiformis TaxID=36881 RepID=A0AAE0LJS0_9CHLO|nr:hypothetical protein CYMTET_4799 [Cymbomonas tetramitiformis]|eukprot:gene18216-21702_t